MKEGTCHSEFVPRATTSLSRISYKLGQEDTRIWNLLLCICDPFFIYRTSEKESRPRILLISTHHETHYPCPYQFQDKLSPAQLLIINFRPVYLCVVREQLVLIPNSEDQEEEGDDEARWNCLRKTRSLYISAFICDVPLAPWWLKIPSALSDKESNAAAAPACSSSGSRIVFMFPVFWFHSFLHLSNSGCV